jgi:hypothetical protein
LKISFTEKALVKSHDKTKLNLGTTN